MASVAIHDFPDAYVRLLCGATHRLVVYMLVVPLQYRFLHVPSLLRGQCSLLRYIRTYHPPPSAMAAAELENIRFSRCA